MTFTGPIIIDMLTKPRTNCTSEVSAHSNLAMLRENGDGNVIEEVCRAGFDHAYGQLVTQSSDTFWRFLDHVRFCVGKGLTSQAVIDAASLVSAIVGVQAGRAGLSNSMLPVWTDRVHHAQQQRPWNQYRILNSSSPHRGRTVSFRHIVAWSGFGRYVCFGHYDHRPCVGGVCVVSRCFSAFVPISLEVDEDSFGACYDNLDSAKNVLQDAWQGGQGGFFYKCS